MGHPDAPGRRLHLRVPGDLHARIAAQAAREGRTISALVHEALDAASPAEPVTDNPSPIDRVGRERA
ncbi:MAG: toxin-antitoxin system HicB family antitoxin [Solirubrobacteraceae bacterium]